MWLNVLFFGQKIYSSDVDISLNYCLVYHLSLPVATLDLDADSFLTAHFLSGISTVDSPSNLRSRVFLPVNNQHACQIFESAQHVENFLHLGTSLL